MPLFLTNITLYLQGFDALSGLDSFMWSSGFYVLMKSIKIINNNHDAYIFLSSLYFVLAFMLVGILYCKDLYILLLFIYRASKAIKNSNFFYSYVVYLIFLYKL